jgi:aldehyde dehydrogenase (NAD+)
MQEEIFGPILPVLTYDKLDEAISFINSRKKPLALYVFTDNKGFADTVLTRTSSGGGCWNDTLVHFGSSYLGFGGVGDSGMGSYHGKKSFDTFTHYKSFIKKSNLIDIAMRYHPYTEQKFSLVRKFLK